MPRFPSWWTALGPGIVWMALAQGSGELTCLTMLLDVPGPLILLSVLIGFAGTVIFPATLFVLNYRRKAPVVPPWARPRAAEALLLGVSFLA